jgi:hypothetical protein
MCATDPVTSRLTAPLLLEIGEGFDIDLRGVLAEPVKVGAFLFLNGSSKAGLTLVAYETIDIIK